MPLAANPLTSMAVRYIMTRNIVTISFGAVVKESREAAGLSQEVFARLAHLDVEFLDALENGYLTPHLVSIFVIAEHLGMRPGVLMDEAYDRVFQSGSGTPAKKPAPAEVKG